jgi:putative tryptophan/tyrosine transport system substrate-binding protein
MNRRNFLALIGCAAAGWPDTLLAQSNERMRRVGVLMDIANDQEGQSRIGAFRHKLQELGWTQGRNLQLEVCWTDADRGRVQACAANLVGSAPDVILANAAVALTALQQATRAIPIVFVQIGEPVEAGLVPRLSNPGGNITGAAAFEYAIGGKWAELLKEIAPRVTRVAVLQSSPPLSTQPGYVRAIVAATPTLGLEPAIVESDLGSAAEIRSVMDRIARQSNGLIVLPSPPAAVHREALASLAASNGLPSIYAYRSYVTSGGLMSYGNNVTATFQRAASQVDRILRGARPGDLPIQFSNTFELAINLKTARALGLTVPPLMLARADEVIE